MFRSPYLSSTAACWRAAVQNHRKHLLLPSKAPEAEQHNEILKAGHFHKSERPQSAQRGGAHRSPLRLMTSPPGA